MFCKLFPLISGLFYEKRNEELLCEYVCKSQLHCTVYEYKQADSVQKRNGAIETGIRKDLL